MAETIEKSFEYEFDGNIYYIQGEFECVIENAGFDWDPCPMIEIIDVNYSYLERKKADGEYADVSDDDILMERLTKALMNDEDFKASLEKEVFEAAADRGAYYDSLEKEDAERAWA